MKIDQIKKNFPIFRKKINGNSLVYLDSANSSQKPKSVIDRMSYFYENEFSNVGRSVHSLAVTATNRFEETRDLVQKFINAKHREEIIFTKGATEGINLVANSFGEKFINEGDEIILTELEHHSNYVPWHYLRNKNKAVINFGSFIDTKNYFSDYLPKSKKNFNDNEITKRLCVHDLTRKLKDKQKKENVSKLKILFILISFIGFLLFFII